MVDYSKILGPLSRSGQVGSIKGGSRRSLSSIQTYNSL